MLLALCGARRGSAPPAHGHSSAYGLPDTHGPSHRQRARFWIDVATPQPAALDCAMSAVRLEELAEKLRPSNVDFNLDDGAHHPRVGFIVAPQLAQPAKSDLALLQRGRLLEVAQEVINAPRHERA